MNFTFQSFSLGLDTRPNQDAIAVKCFSSNRLFAAIADGVGGQKGGEIASKIAVDWAGRLLFEDFSFSFDTVFAEIVKELQKISLNDKTLIEMATTLSLITEKDGRIYFGHVGDSRIYHLRDKGLLQITQDQTEAALLVKQGILSVSRAKTYPRRSVLVSALSVKGDHELMTGSFEIMPRDRILLLTDGVYRLMTKIEIRDLSISSSSLAEFVRNVSERLCVKGLKDDASLIAVDVLG